MKISVPKNIQSAARAAYNKNLSLPMSKRAAYKDDNGKRVAGTGMQTAKKLMSGTVDADQIILMRAWFARHGESPKEKEARKDKNSKAYLAWQLWGGNAGRRFAEYHGKRIDKDKKQK
ncbi:MAG: hypothetical protein VX313_02145 [Bacteroidota bacterium]|nr:hypothetical protein [Bacteroidota bacterium]